MVKHIILWTLRPDLTPEERTRIATDIKQGLEALAGLVPGLQEIKVHTQGRLDTSTADIMLDSTLADPAALEAYARHPAHVEVAEKKVRPYTSQRVCLDFET